MMDYEIIEAGDLATDKKETSVEENASVKHFANPTLLKYLSECERKLYDEIVEREHIAANKSNYEFKIIFQPKDKRTSYAALLDRLSLYGLVKLDDEFVEPTRDRDVIRDIQNKAIVFLIAQHKMKEMKWELEISRKCIVS